MSGDTGAPLHLPYLAASQSQPEVLINEAWETINSHAGSSDGGGSPIDVIGGGTTVPNVTKIRFTSGATVTESSGSVADIAISATGGGVGGSSNGASLLLTSDQSIGNATETPLDFTTYGSVTFDSGGFSGAGSGKLTAPTAGVYLVSACVTFGNSAAGTRALSFCKNGVTGTRIGLASSGSVGAYEALSISALLDLAAGDYIQVLVYQNSGGSLDVYAAENLTVFSMNGIGGANITPDTHPASSTTYDDEFESSGSINARWSWGNQGTSTATVGDTGKLVLTPQNDGHVHAIVQNAPSGTWRFRAKLSMFITASGTGDNFGLFVRNGSGGGCAVWGPFSASGSDTFLLLQCASYTSLTASTYNSVPFTVLATDIFRQTYYEIENDGTNIHFRMSVTGEDGTFIEIASETISSYLGGSITQVGLAGVTNAANAAMYCDWFRRMA